MHRRKETILAGWPRKSALKHRPSLREPIVAEDIRMATIIGWLVLRAMDNSITTELDVLESELKYFRVLTKSLLT